MLESIIAEGTVATVSLADLIINGTGTLVVNSNYLDGIVSKDGLKIISANIEINSQDDGIRGKDYVAINQSNITINSGGDGIKATNDTDTTLGYVKIEGGKININSTDDSIHANGIIIINNGTMNLQSGDDAIHADTNIVINEGEITIPKSYEGIESSYIEINGGTIEVVASDDGINISGGNDSSSIDGRIGQNNFSNIGETNQKLVINHGNITVDASGDGLDANGAIYINGGRIVVKGPTSSGNGAMDYDSTCDITGGEVILYGSAGMWQNPSSTSTQYILTFQVTGSSGDEVILKDSNGNEIASFETEKTYGMITISNEQIKQGETYTLYINGINQANLTANNIITSDSSMGGNGMNNPGMNEPGMKQPGGRR